MTKRVYLVTGSNAAGKTTAVTRALEPWASDPRLVNIDADSDRLYKGTPEEQREAIRVLFDRPAPVVVVTGTRINKPVLDVIEEHGQRDLTVFVVTQKPGVMRAHLQARCEKTGKAFREDYWTHRTLEYEGMRRYSNAVTEAGHRPLVVDMDMDYHNCELLVKLLRDAVAVDMARETA